MFMKAKIKKKKEIKLSTEKKIKISYLCFIHGSQERGATSFFIFLEINYINELIFNIHLITNPLQKDITKTRGVQIIYDSQGTFETESGACGPARPKNAKRPFIKQLKYFC
ncbi:hypothetical protein BpHYR1_002253 [Brachionus plicatilis]|uniref:Uncharacterized protein n=1 Tax=Brachionus plicatilis TaxID=10195 RepID=A0A3M7PIT8_BRAPC|nr:hypothetical protein BpHYR1_002253 [Brachionus plicatilis]